MNRLVSICLLLFTVYASSNMLYGQLGLKVGYAGVVFNPKNTNTILNEFNILNPRLENNFKPIRYSNGISFGTRYQLSRNFALNVDWVGAFDYRKADVQKSDESITEMRLSTGLHSIKAGVDFFFGPVGFGASFDYQMLNIRLTENGVGEKLVSANGYAYTIYTELNFLSNNNITASIRPYVQIPLSDYDISPIAERLDVPELNTNDSFWNWGFTVIFINGSY